MTKKEDTLAALMQLKRALSQGRDIASGVLGHMIERVQDGDDLSPNPVVARAPRQPMAPMVTRAKPAKKAETTDEKEDAS